MELIAFFPCDEVIEGEEEWIFKGFPFGGCMTNTFPDVVGFEVVLAFHCGPKQVFQIELEVIAQNGTLVDSCHFSYESKALTDLPIFLHKACKFHFQEPGSYWLLLNSEHLTLAKFPLHVIDGNKIPWEKIH